MNSDYKELYSCYADVRPTDIDWLWYPYIPYGKLTVLQGDPGDGKSTLAIRIAAILTTAGEFPDGRKCKEAANVIYQCAEDDASDTIIHRLHEAGADCKKVLFINEGNDPLTLDDARIEKTIKSVSAKLVIIDPIQAFIPQDGDMQNAASMRKTMRKLAAVAQKNNCAILMIGHMNKASGGKKLYRGLGSIDIAAIARSVLMITRDESYPSIRYMFPVKSSLAHEGSAISFTIDENAGFTWLGRCEVPDSSTGIIKTATQTKLERAEAIIQIMLSSGDMQSSQILEKFERLNISSRTVRNAQKMVGVVAYKKGNAWYWHIPTEEDQNSQS